MAESLESIITGLIVLVAAVVIATSHFHRYRRLGRGSGHRLWDRLRHRQ